ncbi:hypothetical protein NP233_g8543 [Leucocoprinus birnbaumii]|uniref:F-box domain-containing protein n=1 Tax=Leucocoprinus birnbaumii TaxID=56174 RepID=A0AAD5VMQ7_9AGAR|nr:hypothetical protein NP233_g8543 [Leucocoprinus birnbaumii]
MPIILANTDEPTARKKVQSLKSTIATIDVDIKRYHNEAISIRAQRDKLVLRASEARRPAHPSKLIGLIPSCLRWPRLRLTAELQLPVLDRELEHAERKLFKLRRERNALERLLHMYEATFAPIAKVPPEILQIIFLFTIPSGHSAPSISQTPISLTLVCHKWRMLALDTPALWAAISTSSDWPLRAFSPIPISPYSSELYQTLRNPSLSIARSNQPLAWLHRARGLPFWMEIVIPRHDLWFGPQDPYRTWVLQTSSEWSHLRILGRASHMAALLIAPFPKLETLELVGESYDYLSRGLVHAYDDFNLNPHHFHRDKWTALTIFDASVTWIMVEQLVRILKHAPVLQVCRAQIFIRYGRDTLHIRPRVAYPSLLSLELKFGPELVWKTLLDHCILPSLTSLHLLNLCSNSICCPGADRDIADFGQRSRCPLRAFRAVRVWKNENRAAAAVQNICLTFPTLKEVDIRTS